MQPSGKVLVGPFGIQAAVTFDTCSLPEHGGLRGLLQEGKDSSTDAQWKYRVPLDGTFVENLADVDWLPVMVGTGVNAASLIS